MNDSFTIKRGDIARRYDSLSFELRTKAWKSFKIWMRNPIWDGARFLSVKNKMFSDLFKLKNFFPASDKNLVMKMFESLPGRSPGEYFTMIRLSQNERPLVWVMAQGGTGKIIRVRIGVEGGLYSVVLAGGKRYESEDLQEIMKKLRDHYIFTPRRFHAWPLFFNQATIRFAPEEALAGITAGRKFWQY